MTEQTYSHKRDLPAFSRAVRAILQDRLTDTQYRRVALLYGFDGDPLSERQAAAVEGCGRPRVQRSREAALRKLRQNGELWMLWLLADSELNEGRGSVSDSVPSGVVVAPIGHRRNSGRNPDNQRDWSRAPLFDSTPGVAVVGDFHTVEAWSDGDHWESDRYNLPADEMEAYGDGWIACHEFVSREDNPYAPQNRRGKRADPTRREWADRMQNAWRRGWLDARRKIRDEAKATA